ncbi:death domain-associated protein 6 [Pistacia vera]|uniref:death domain-associated protein 6 n=1 Tax=Pistacia vera TaxID=55513 RepID=UPI00126318FD|nr:death domain-associated protein 6 [Pistacia vera]
MGCFLGCFGFSSKRKRRKPANKVLPGDPRHGSYEPLDSSVSTHFDITENPASSDSQLSNRIKIGKKVSFNLNVQTYEPLSKEETVYHLPESHGEEEKEKSGAETAKGSLFSVSEGNSTAAKTGSFPPNYRYQKLTDSYEDEDDFEYNESDLDFDDDYEGEEENEEEYYDDDDEGEGEEEEENEEAYYDAENEDVGGVAIDIDDQRVTKSEFLKQLNSQPEELSQGISWIHSAEDKSNNHIQLPGSIDGELKSIDLKRNARDRSQFVNSVLNPVENLTQWKAVKARAAAPKHLRKENNALQQEPQTPFDFKKGSNMYPSSLGQNHSQSEALVQEIAVNASLSNWLASQNPNESKATGIINNSSISVENIPPKRSMFDRSCLQESREDTPILDITNLKA